MYYVPSRRGSECMGETMRARVISHLHASLHYTRTTEYRPPGYTDVESVAHSESLTPRPSTEALHRGPYEATKNYRRKVPSRMALAGASENGGGCGPPNRGAYRDYESRWTSHMGITCSPLPSPSPSCPHESKQDPELPSSVRVYIYVYIHKPTKHASGALLFQAQHPWTCLKLKASLTQAETRLTPC